jgi:DNA-binding SARP family transcriptional activator/predicted ATPase
MPLLSIQLIGPLVVTHGGRPVTFTYDKVRALLAYLAVESLSAASNGGPISRARLAGLLWPDQPHGAAQDSLRQALASLRRQIDDRGSSPPFLLVEHDSIQINRASDIQIDLDSFQDALAQVAAHRHRSWAACPTCAALLEKADALVRGEFVEDLSLPDSDLFESWATTWRERIKIQALDLFGGLAQFHERRGETERTLVYAARQIEIDPYHEPAHRQLMQALVRSGQRSQAVLHFNNLKRLLADELDILPGAETMALFEAIRQGGPLPEPSNGRVRNLPVPLAPLVGRVVELSELAVWLADPERRLISLVGPGGVGKTRLVIEAVRPAAAMFAGGVVYVPLIPADATPAPGPSPEQELSRSAVQEEWRSQAGVIPGRSPLAGAIGGALGLPGADGQWAATLAALRNQEMLLVLDGFEHVLPERGRVAELLEANARLVVLTTTRQRLALAGEWVFGLGGLDTCPPYMDSQLEAYSAGALFCLCARQVSQDFELDNANRASVGEICRLVNGLPLAIRLAAAWAGSLSCAEIAAEISRGIDILSGQPAPGPDEGQSSVRAVFEQSWKRLDPRDQAVFARLSVFRGGFDHASAEQVAGASRETLARLVDQSLLRMSHEGRYDLHDLLRQFGAEKLRQAGAEAATRQGHFEWYAAQAELNERRLNGAGTLTSFIWLIRESANLQAALAWAQANAPGQAGQVARWMHADFHQSGVHLISRSGQPKPTF